jgi:predicted ester cyclase
MRFASLLILILTATGCLHGAGPQRPDPVADLSGADPELVAVLQQRIAAGNAHDFDTWQSLHTTQCVRTAPELEAPLQGAAEMRAAIERLTRSVPDYHVALIRAVGAGPWIAAELRSSGQMQNGLEVPGHFFKIPATGKRFEQTWTAFVRFEGTRIAEFREHYDQTDLSDQLMGKTTPKTW